MQWQILTEGQIDPLTNLWERTEIARAPGGWMIRTIVWIKGNANLPPSVSLIHAAEPPKGQPKPG